ncbi:MAG: protoheme IX farnesyltransferase [Holophaga sp.]|nr:protoheme IX farnesyltransferase [Holophaga sp.]
MTHRPEAPPSPGPGRDFSQLTKLSISSAATLTAAAGYLAALRGWQWGLFSVLLGTLLLAMGSSALNEVQEKHYDARMLRTLGRPLPAERMSRRVGLLIGLALGGAGFLLLLWLHGWVPALLGALALFWYNGVYTPLKRVTAFAIIPGALIGAIPPAIGWTAAGGSLASPALLSLCLIFFLWQVPHFWMLMLLHDRDYGRADFPTLSRHFRSDQSARLSFTWMAATAFSCAFMPCFGAVASLAGMAGLGAASLWLVWKATALLRSSPDDALFRRTFWNINLFAMALIVLVMLDPFLPV